ncbi:PbsX family transcriptional regulator [Caballeronia sp. LjRoot34]|uniref:AbrB/MazE/SpoVT family DNA-binding domain-containing protein n=1 Tax=Caballeronia sp. LjRoot34 TaxID=3342325 RepID=UPI003ECEAFF9
MHVVIEKTGNSGALLVADAEAGRIATMPARFAAYDLNHLLAGITRDNMHAEVACGPAAGAEAF